MNLNELNEPPITRELLEYYKSRLVLAEKAAYDDTFVSMNGPKDLSVRSKKLWNSTPTSCLNINSSKGDNNSSVPKRNVRLSRSMISQFEESRRRSSSPVQTQIQKVEEMCFSKRLSTNTNTFGSMVIVNKKNETNNDNIKVNNDNVNVNNDGITLTSEINLLIDKLKQVHSEIKIIKKKATQKKSMLFYTLENQLILMLNDLREQALPIFSRSQNHLKVMMNNDKTTLTSDFSEANVDMSFNSSKINKMNKKVSLEVVQEDLNVPEDYNCKNNDVENEIKQNTDLNMDSFKHCKDSFHNKSRNEMLMMGYVQINGHLVLNDKMIKIEKFEELKASNNTVESSKSGLVSNHLKMNQKGGFTGYLDSLSIKLNTLLKNHSMSSLNEFKKIQDSKYILYY
ncbi:hypothetical protein PCK1_000958 [Pneumocystis canis]|nr:hypothetical protein PCK1_000958 [Pneumocystis canis]